MKTYKEYPYQSALAPYIRDFLSEKRALGFIYEGKSYQLFRLDQLKVSQFYGLYF